jgi:dTDP-rhamnose C3-O-methyltransferase
MTRFDGFKKSDFDAALEERIEQHCKKFDLSFVEAVHHFPLLSRRQMLKRFLAHTEFFKMTLDVPGDIAELGVFRGLGLMTWANLLESYCIGSRTKVVYGFDNWRGFDTFDLKDGAPDANAGKIEGGFSAAKDELENAIAIFDDDRFISHKPRIKLIDGNIEETIPRFVRENPGVRFSLVHFDCDLYRPTKVALEMLWPNISRGGVVLFDEYAVANWPGETAAVDEFLADKPNIKVRAITWTNAPAGYLVKES